MNDISAIIVAKGTPAVLKDTIKSVESVVSEIIIADIGLDSDYAKKLSLQKNLTIIRIQEEVPYVERIREKLKKYAKHPYVLVMDPDEIITPELASLLADTYTKYDYISIPRRNIIMKKWMRHSRWWPDYQVRLVKKESVTWPTEIHQQPRVSGRGYTVEAREELAIIHHNYENFDEYLTKALRYAKSEAGELIASSTTYNLRTSIRRGLSEFISRFFADEGYKDGMHGFVLSFMQMMYYFLVYFYYWEQKGYPTVPAADMSRDIRSFFRDGLYESNHWMVKKKTAGGIKSLSLKIQNVLSALFH